VITQDDVIAIAMRRHAASSSITICSDYQQPADSIFAIMIIVPMIATITTIVISRRHRYPTSCP